MTALTWQPPNGKGFWELRASEGPFPNKALLYLRTDRGTADMTYQLWRGLKPGGMSWTERTPVPVGMSVEEALRYVEVLARMEMAE